MRALQDKIKRGFSLVEMLVATAVFVMMLTLLLTITSQMNSAWQQADAQKSRRQSARALLDTIVRDMESALLPLNSGNTEKVWFLMNPAAVGFRHRDCLFWQAALPEDGGKSDVTMVGYFVRWDGTRSILCRVHIPPGDPNYRIYEAPETWLNDAFLNTVAPADKASDYRGLLAENVFALWVTLRDRQGSLIVAPYDSRVANNLPASAEVALVIADPSAARRLNAPLATYNQTTVEGFVDALPEGVRKGVQIFRTRINLETSR